MGVGYRTIPVVSTGVAVTSATVIIYGHAIWDPVQLLTKFENHAVLVVAMLSLCLATLATNIAANVVSPANDFAHLWPKRISFRIGGLITGLVGIAIQPWRLLENASVYIDKWLIGYSLLLGAIVGTYNVVMTIRQGRAAAQQAGADVPALGARGAVQAGE